MAYYNLLKQSPYLTHLSHQLHEHLNGEELQDASVEYKMPEIIIEPTDYKKKESFSTKPTDVRLPARLSSPLIPYPDELKDYITNDIIVNRDMLHGHHMCQIDALKTVIQKCISTGKLPTGPTRFDMDGLKKFARQSYSHREDLINTATLAFAERATSHDLSISADAQVNFKTSAHSISKYTSFIIMIQRLRVHIAKSTLTPTFDPTVIQLSQDEASYTMFSNGVYVYGSDHPKHHFVILSCGGHFAAYHADLKYWFQGPTSYLDYIFTIADILNNLDVLKNCPEYSWAIPTFEEMIRFAEHEGYHKQQVDFMKNLEGFLLNMSDYDEEYAMNWKPILEVLHELWMLDQQISGCSYDFGLTLGLLRGIQFVCPKSSYLCRFILIGKSLKREQLQEISALHKLIFYAEVNAEAGVNKFLKRVHTPRKVEENAVKNLTRMAKMLFLIAYRKRHKNIPNIIGPLQKVRLLETYSQKSDFNRIETLPLSWWDEIKIFDCMDNTLTDDPLEFAKDKGALKSSISFGPGDSRKELLQVIEKEDYALTEFFSNRKIERRPKKVRITTQQHNATQMKDPARLIEKEKEQKFEARLFANGELSNKHSLSLVAARMKKALAYFDEQLMTPTDKKRKALIHEASRELSQKDNYSLLLDIEGHNQSMQASNTAELAEFMGHLFGQEGWGQLPDYFGSLTVFHYDEYLDRVTESHGQLGGIEGWLNPFWTLHTTLMMKLLRVMTDVSVKTIMVYSDDVDAIINIRQASEPMVQSVFSKIMTHCSKFGMTVKYSQTTLSKHRITMLRQHYADGIRADSTLKRLLAVSAGNNPMLVSEELEVAGICSSASSAMELSNHHEACSYLKNYKLGLLLCRMPQMILSHINNHSMTSPEELPAKLSNLLYYSKDDRSQLDLKTHPELMQAAQNDIAAYLGRHPKQISTSLAKSALSDVYGVGVAEMRLVDSPDRVLYLQVYDKFLQDLLFFWAYLPTSLGGLGASLHLNLMLSGHSVGLTKSLHYLHAWTHRYSSDTGYFLRYLTISLGIDMDSERNFDESRLVTNAWPGDQRITPATTSVQQSIKSAVRRITRNKKILEMFTLSDDRDRLARNLVEIFRNNFHSRIVQFYHENTSIHFIDLLISKIETSSGLLLKVRNLLKLRNSICSRAIENIRMSANTSRTLYFELTASSDIVSLLLHRKCSMFPKIKFIEVEEILYDDKIEEVDARHALLTIRRCAPTHYRNGIRVYDDPKVGNETLYKGEILDDDRMLGNKEELLAAKLVAVTKWSLMKHNLLNKPWKDLQELDMVKACNMSLATLTNQRFQDLVMYAPTETGGEILHRIPNIRFSTMTYIRSEMNRSLHYTTDLDQRRITEMGLVDSNVNFDYLRMRYLVAAIVRDKHDELRRLVVRYAFKKLTGILDVQFVSPRFTIHTVKDSFKCYSDLRGHQLSKMRFRYLSHSYLYIENVTEWALIPKLTEAETATEIGKNYINDILLRYSRDLDRDYMLTDPKNIDVMMWQPLIDKLYRIDGAWRMYPGLSETEEIAHRLECVMAERTRLTTVDKTNHVLLSVQSSCLEAIATRAPDDIEMQQLVIRYSQLAQNRRHSSKLSVRLAQYQSILSNLAAHKLRLAKSLILEYIATFHFKTKVEGSILTVDVLASVEEFQTNALGKFSLMLINPELQVRIMILGFEFVEKVVEEHLSDLKEEFTEICSEIYADDIIVPSSLPTINGVTNLTGTEPIPDFLDEIEYLNQPIPNSAMATLDQAVPLFKFAHKCSTTGARPETFFSHTGSDSLGAQVGLFRMMISEGIIDEDMRICDLTAGRGDGLYAGKHLGLDITSFSVSDTFTKVMFNPGIEVKNDYDIFNGGTLKFMTGYDFIHIDVSFTGSATQNVLDLILLLERSNLAYSIRLNSVQLEGYDANTTADLPSYKHSIAYAMNDSMKPYQIYLIGQPDQRIMTWSGPEMKSTVAFKAMALSYARLLSPTRQYDRIEEYQPNSLSIYLPRGDQMVEYLSRICDDSIGKEQLYYLQRYAAEIGNDSVIEFAYNCLDKAGQHLAEERTRWCEVRPECRETGFSLSSIGNVSDNSRPYHEKHINAMLEHTAPIWSIRSLDCDEPLLIYFRTKHPIQEIRSRCNILLGLLKFCRASFLSGHDALIEDLKLLTAQGVQKMSMHQREINLAIKLLVLAARDDDYTYGIRYCHKLMSANPKMSKSPARTLRSYRLISYLFREIKQMMSRGMICIRSIEAIANEIEVREKVKFKYRRIDDQETPELADNQLLNDIINGSIDTLFAGLENFSVSIIEGYPGKGNTDTEMEDILGKGMEFNMDIDGHVEKMIKQLNLVPSGPRGIIDLDDEPIMEFDDW